MGSYNKRFIIGLIITVYLLIPSLLPAQFLYINEFLASNSNTLDDEDGNSSDWIEIYNNSDESINLSGCTITDESDEPYQWIFPDVEIPSKSYFLLWTSGKNRKNEDVLHTNFKLDADGESIGLYLPDGNIADSLTFGAQQRDISQGRWPDGEDSFYFLRNQHLDYPMLKKFT